MAGHEVDADGCRRRRCRRPDWAAAGTTAMSNARPAVAAAPRPMLETFTLIFLVALARHFVNDIRGASFALQLIRDRRRWSR